MRLGFITDNSAVNSNYRAYQPMMALVARGHHVRRNERNTVDVAQWFDLDAVLIHRYSDDGAFQTVKRLQSAGVAVIWDNDDDLVAFSKARPRHGRGNATTRRGLEERLRRMIRTVDAVSTPSEALASAYRSYGANEVHVLENFVPDSFVETRKQAHEGVVVAWLAGLEHQVDYQRLRLDDAFARLLDAHPYLRVLSIGLGLGLRTDRYQHTPLVDFLELNRNLAVADVGVAPLVDAAWNRARSNVKLKEYASLGIPWLASPVGPYRAHGPSEGGNLVADDQWFAALDALVRSARQRRRLGKHGKRWAKGQTISGNIGRWELLFDVAARRRSVAFRQGRPPVGGRSTGGPDPTR